MLQKVYAVKHKSDDIRANSRSGGIFTAISDLVIEQGGIVYGCMMKINNKEAIHMRAISKEERNLMRGSKYIQSIMGNTFLQVRSDLQDGKVVLFSGTSCQILGLQKFLDKEYSNLLCMDIVCHGVPSPKVWGSYLEWIEKKHDSKIKNVEFRNKKDFGWHAHVETITLENGKIINSEIFKELFYSHEILRPSCFKCPFKSIHHPGDITIADYWGINKAAPGFDDDKGISLILINSDKGQKWFDCSKDNIIWKETNIEDSLQPPLVAPFPEPDSREVFWEDYENKDFSYIVKKYTGKQSIIKRIKRKIVKNLKN